MLVKERTDTTQTGSKCIEQAAKETSGLITWLRFPDKFTHESRGPAVTEGDSVVRVQYVCAEGADGASVIVLQNSFADMTPSVYVIRFSPDDIEFKLLPRRGESGGSGWSSFETSPTVIGIRRLEGSPPEVLVLFGPSGSGHFSAIYAYRLEGLGKYQPIPVAEFSGNTNYHLDTAKNEFIYYQHIEDKTVRSVVRLK